MAAIERVLFRLATRKPQLVAPAAQGLQLYCTGNSPHGLYISKPETESHICQPNLKCKGKEYFVRVTRKDANHYAASKKQNEATRKQS